MGSCHWSTKDTRHANACTHTHAHTHWQIEELERQADRHNTHTFPFPFIVTRRQKPTAQDIVESEWQI